MQVYLPVLLLFIIGIVVSVAVIFGVKLLGPKHPTRFKDMPFECGVPQSGDAKKRFSVRFYLVAISFLLFDVEVALLFPWALAFRKFLQINTFILFSMLVFLAVLTIAFIYEWRRGGLEWE